jgi:hypothetical protein
MVENNPKRTSRLHHSGLSHACHVQDLWCSQPMQQPVAIGFCGQFQATARNSATQSRVIIVANALTTRCVEVKDSIMRTMTQALLALGFVGAMAVSTPVAVTAQQNNLSSLGVDVEIGNRPDRYQNYRRQHRDFDNYFAVDRLPSTQRCYNDGYGYSVEYGYSEYREPIMIGMAYQQR